MQLPSRHDVSSWLPELRRLHPDLDVYFNAEMGEVLLLQYQAEKERIRRGRVLLARGINTVDAHLMVQGFALFEEMSYAQAVQGNLVRRARHILSVTPRMLEAHFATLRAESDGTAAELRAEARMRDRIRSEYRSDHRIFFRHKKSFTVNQALTS